MYKDVFHTDFERCLIHDYECEQMGDFPCDEELLKTLKERKVTFSFPKQVHLQFFLRRATLTLL